MESVEIKRNYVVGLNIYVRCTSIHRYEVFMILPSLALKWHLLLFLESIALSFFLCI